MGTKNNPGKFDCYSKADPDEPMFVLLGRDPVASVVIRFWMYLRERVVGAERDLLEEARSCADAMTAHARKLGKGKLVSASCDLYVHRQIVDRVDRLRGPIPPPTRKLSEGVRARERELEKMGEPRANFDTGYVRMLHALLDVLDEREEPAEPVTLLERLDRLRSRHEPSGRDAAVLTLGQILEEGVRIWGAVRPEMNDNHRRQKLQRIIVRLGVGIGDLCRLARGADKDRSLDLQTEMAKELGNIIASTIRWCHELGLNPDDCVREALAAQRKFAQENTSR